MPFKPGFNIVVGEITTGKTTLVRLIRGLLGTFPSSLPPEVQHVSAVRGEVALGEETWLVYRPRTTTSSAIATPNTMKPPIDQKVGADITPLISGPATSCPTDPPSIPKHCVNPMAVASLCAGSPCAAR